MSETASASDMATSKRGKSGLGDTGGVTGAEFAVQIHGTIVETGFGIGIQFPRRLETPFRGEPYRQRAGQAINSAHLRKGQELVDSIDPADSYDTQLYLSALRGTVAEMWESAADCSELHQDILATFENGVRQAVMSGSVTPGQLAAFREALNDLGQPTLVRANGQVVRSEFVRQGFTALGFAEHVNEKQDTE